MKTIFLKVILSVVILLKKLQRIFINFHEWIFKRKELQQSKTMASLLEQEADLMASTIKIKSEQIEKGEAILNMLYSGDAVRLTHNEKGMILDAIEYVPFKEGIELPETKAQVRITWRELREKIKLHLKADPVVEKMDITPEAEPEAKEDDDTKLA